jgi:hypothetical protein
MSMHKIYLSWFFTLLGVLCFLGIQTVAGETSNINADFVDPGWNSSIQYQSVYELYQAAGFSEYFRQRALLWTETTKRRNDLLPKLPAGAIINIQQLQGQLLRLLEFNPGDPAALLMTGNYHYFYRQKQTALWYYQQAQKFAPDSEAVRLALADFYLGEWQPEQAKETLTGLKSPAVSLRMGAACLQSGEYVLALGYLIQADPLPEEWQVIRAKDLCKTYLALGDPKQADGWIRPEYLESSSIISGTLFWELKGWSAWQSGNSKEAVSDWQAGQRMNGDYKLWESNIQWLRPDHSISLANATKDFHDSDLNAAFEVSQGQALFEEGQWSLAYDQYLAAIHHDHRSLLGFLGACTVGLCKQEYAKVLDLAKQGLAVNQDFKPLLAIRAQAYEKLGQQQRNEAAEEWAAAKALTQNTGKSLMTVKLIGIAGRTVIWPQGETKNLAGFWVSTEGKGWQWYPWGGVPLALTTAVSKAWVVPTGPGISGAAFYREKFKPINEPLQITSPQSQDGQVTIHSSFPTRLIVTSGDQQDMKSYIGEVLTVEHQMPASTFSGDKRNLLIYWLNQEGEWGKFQYSLELPVSQPETPGQSIINAPESLVDQRQIQLDTTPPVITLLGESMDTRGILHLNWSASENAICWLRLLTSDGSWRELPVPAASDGIYMGDAPLESTVFCQIAARDQAGNTSVITDKAVNNRLQGSAAVSFRVNNGQEKSDSRWITIKPSVSTPDLKWTASNDQLVWSGWQQGDTVMKWRLNPGVGIHLVFIRYQTAGTTRICYQVIEVLSVVPDIQSEGGTK